MKLEHLTKKELINLFNTEEEKVKILSAKLKEKNENEFNKTHQKFNYLTETFSAGFCDHIIGETRLLFSVWENNTRREFREFKDGNIVEITFVDDKVASNLADLFGKKSVEKVRLITFYKKD